jgi:alpha-tubulin suppressor-like RCC1 family protein
MLCIKCVCFVESSTWFVRMRRKKYNNKPPPPTTTNHHTQTHTRYNGNGQTDVPPDLGLYRVRSVATGLAHTCVIMAYDKLRCWGSDYWGQITVPADVNLGRVTHLAAGENYTCAAGTGTYGKLVCWGNNPHGAMNVPDNLGKLPEF